MSGFETYSTPTIAPQINNCYQSEPDDDASYRMVCHAISTQLVDRTYENQL